MIKHVAQSKITVIALLAALAALIPQSSLAVNFTAGDLALVVAAGSGSNTNCSIVEINTTTAAQTALQTIAVPGTGTSAIRVSGSATSTLYVSDSNDGSLLCFTGVNLDGSTTANVNTLNPRAVVTANNSGTLSVATTYTGTSGNQTRGACTVNNAAWFIGDQGGFYSNGTTAASPAGNIRAVKSFGGTVYAFVASASAPPVGTISAATGGTFTALPGLANGATSRQDFYLISSGSNGSAFDVLYVLDATSASAGTIYKYSLVSGSWTANGTYTTTFGGFGLCAAKSGTGAVLYITSGTGATANNNVIKATDTAGYNTTLAITTANNLTLYSATSGSILKGLAFAPISTVTVDNTGSPAAGAISTGNNNVALFGFQLTLAAGTVDFTGLKLTTAGTATTSDLGNFRVVYDANANGVYDAGDVIVSTSSQNLANPINFTITGQTGLSASRRYLVIADVAAGATPGRTFTGSIAAATDVTASLTVSGTAAGSQQTIATAPLDLTMTAVTASESGTISSLNNDAAITTVSQGTQVWQVTFANPAGNSGAGTITALSFTQGANNLVANWQNTIQAATLFDGTTALAAGTISATNLAFAGLSVNVADGSAKTLTLRMSLQSTAGALPDHAAFQFALTAGNVAVNGNGVVSADLASDASQNVISVVATRLAFTSVPSIVLTNKVFTASVQAQDANGNCDLDDATSVTITLAGGAGALTGGDPLYLLNGTNHWPTLVIDTAGTFSLQASGGTLASAVSSSIVARLQPTVTELVMPQFIQGGLASNTKRVPFAACVTVGSLVPNTIYRYYTQAATSSDLAATDGAGNSLFANPSGSFGRTTGPSLGTAGGYGSFTTDASGNYTGWFLVEPTGNASHFATAGTLLFLRIVLNDGASGTSVFARATTPDSATVLAFGTDAASGTGIWGSSSATNKNFVVLYDNIAGSGRPLTATFVEDDGQAENTAASYVKFYNDDVDGVAGAWGSLVPNNNANGVQRIEQRALAGGGLIFANTSATGLWPSGASTVNPAGGDGTPIVITATDAPLMNVAVTTPVITGISVSSGNVQIDFTGGPSDSIGNFSVVSTTDLRTAPAAVSATITTSGAGVFRATIPISAPTAFYQIKR